MTADINRWYHEETAKRAREGDTDAARELLQDFVDAIGQYSAQGWEQHGGKPVYFETARYLADAIQRILAGNDPALAFGIKSSKPGRRKGTTTYDTTALAAAYWFLIRHGYKPECANESLSDEIGADRRTIQNASTADGNECYGHPDLIPDELLKSIIKPYQKQVTAILSKKKTARN